MPALRAVEDGDFYDPNALTLGVQVVEGYYRFLLSKTDVVSGVPSSGASLTFAARDLLAQASDGDIFDLLNSVFLFARDDDPPSADLRVWAAITNGPIQIATAGVGCFVQADSSDWRVGHLACVGGTWSATAASASLTTTRGARAQPGFMTSTTQRRIQACPIDADGLGLAGSNTASGQATVAVGNDLTHFAIGIGFVTGSGGSAVDVDCYGAEIFLKQPDILRARRP